MTAAAALAIAGATLYLGRRDVTRPAVAFGVVWFACVALAQLRLTQLEMPWTTGFTLLTFGGGAAFMLAALLAGGTEGARGRLDVVGVAYRPARLDVAALVLFAGALAGLAYKAHVLGGIPLLSGHADQLRAKAYTESLPSWSTFLTDGFFLAMWCALAALWVSRGQSTWPRNAARWLLAAAGLLGVASFASRNGILLALVVPLVVLYVSSRATGVADVRRLALSGAVILAVVVGVFSARVAQAPDRPDAYLDGQAARLPAVVRPALPLYVNAVYPLEAARRLYGAVPEHRPYSLGAASLTSLPDAAFPHGKPPIGAVMGTLMATPPTPGLLWTVGSYQARLYADLGWAGVLLGSLLLGLAFGALYRWARGRSGLLPATLIAYLAYYSAYMVYDNQLSFSLVAFYDLAVVAAVAARARRRPAATG